MTTKECQELLKNPRDKLICIDIDGVLCKGEFWTGEENLKPRQEMIDYSNNLYKKGAHIIIYTARFPSLYQETFAYLFESFYEGIIYSKKI